MADPRIMGAVLAGGASSRMGADKAFIEIEGVPMVVRAVRALRAAGAEPAVVVGGDHGRLDALGLQHLGDRYPGQGPLGGVITALGALESGGIDAVATLPCDVIEPDPAAIGSVIGRLVEDSSADVVVPLGDGVPQWMHAAWRRRCLEPLTDAFGRGVRALSEGARELQAVEMCVQGTAWFSDADRPEDLPSSS